MVKQVFFFVLLLAAACATGHEGEDHGDSPAAVTTAPGANPTGANATGATELFEAVLAHEAGKSVLHLDGYADNAPVTGARVELSGAGVQEILREREPGVYVADTELPPGPLSLMLTIEAAQGSDLLTLEVASDPVPPHTEQSAHGAWRNYLAMMLVIPAAGLAAWGYRRYRRGRV